jgi:hypothetical protein
MKPRNLIGSVFTLALVAFLAAPLAAHSRDDDRGHGKGNGKGHGNSGSTSSALRDDFALFDGTNPENQPAAGAVCGARRGRAYQYHVAVANYGSDGFLRLTYADGDWVQFPIAAGASFSLSQAAGSRGGADRAVRVSNGGSEAQLAGVMSAQNGRCGSCDADGGLGDAGCDAFVPD